MNRKRPRFVRTVRTDRVASIAMIGLLIAPGLMPAIAGRGPLSVLWPWLAALLVSVVVMLVRYAMISRVFRAGRIVDAHVLRIIRRVRSRTATVIFGYTVDGAHIQSRHDFLLSNQIRHWAEGDVLEAVVDVAHPTRVFIIDAFV